MAKKPIEEWHDPSPAPSYEGGLSSSDDEGGDDVGGDDESTLYEEEVLTLRAPKKRRMEAEDDPTYTLEKAEEEDRTDMPEKTGPSTQQSRTPV
jgi:hypothetical protein